MDTVEILKLLWPVILLQLALQVYALVDLTKKNKTKNLSMAAWAVIIIVGGVLGAGCIFVGWQSGGVKLI